MKTKILGIKINKLSSYMEAYSKVEEYVKGNSPSAYITVNNVHTIIEGVLKKDYGNIINNAFMAFPDGKPLSVIVKLKGAKSICRIFGPTFLTKTLELGQKDKIKHFFFGSSPEIISKIKIVIENKYPDTKIVGMVSPPFRILTNEENEKYLTQINESKADIIWIGLGAPKQEIWMYENYKKLNHGVMIGIGAGFDYLAGNTSHAPKWMKDFALEWLYRLIQEPRRLWKRYLVTNTLFIVFVILEMLHLKKFEK